MSLRLPVLVNGDSRTLLLPATDPETGAPLTIPPAATLIFSAKHSKYAPDTEAVFQKVTGAGITFAGSTVTVEIVSADTEPLAEYADLFCDVQAQDVSFGIRTIWEGVLPVRLGVTQGTTTSVPVYTSNPPLPGGGGSGDMLASVYDTNADGKVNAADAADSVPWSGVTGTPTTLAGYGITDGGSGGGGSGDMLKSVYDPDADGKVSLAVAADSVPYSGVTGKPATFPPSAHTHPESDVTGLVAALAAKADGTALAAHVADTTNPHAVTKAQVGLGSVDNTSDLAKPVSTATQTALNGKAALVHTHATTDIIGFAAAAAAAAPVQSVAGLTGAPTAAQLRTALALVVGTDVQAFDSDLAAIAALATTVFGRSLLTQADAATARATLGAGTSSFDGAFSSLTGAPTTLGGYGITDAQPLDGDLTAIAALLTTAYGRSLLTQADGAAVRALIGAGVSSFDGAFSSLTGKPTTLTGYGITDAQPSDADLTAIAALTTTAFGRSVLTQLDGPAVRALIGAGTSSFDGSFASLTSKPTTLAGYGITDAQGLNTTLTALAAVTTTVFGRSLLTQADAAATRATIGAGTSSFDGAFSSLTAKPTTLAGYGITDAQGLDSDLTALASNVANGLWARTGTGTGSARTITGTANQVTVTNGDGVSGNPILALPQSIATASSPTFAGLTLTGALIPGTGSLTAGTGKIYTTAGSGLVITTGTGTGQDFLLADGPGNSLVEVPHGAASATVKLVNGTVQVVGNNVGIGVTPSTTLHVKGVSRVERSNNSLQYGEWSLESGNVVQNSAGSLNHVWQCNGTERMRLDSSGNLGIGGIPTADTRFKVFGADQTSANYAMVVADSATGTLHYIRNDGLCAWFSGGTEKMRIDTSGNLGLGMAPTYKLDLTTASAGFAIRTTTPGDFIWTATGNAGATPLFSIRSNAAAGVFINTLNSAALVLGVSASGTPGTTANSVQIGSSGNVGIASAPSVNARIYVAGQTTDNTAFSAYFVGSTGTTLLAARNDGAIYIPQFATFTTASAANMYCDGNVIYKSTSSARYKEDIADYSRGLSDLLKLRPVSYKGRAEIDAGKTFAGLIAEEVEAAGLIEYVTHDKEGRPDALHYSQMVALVINAIKDVAARLDTLERN